MNLESVPVGFRDIYSASADEAIENARIENATGTSTAEVVLVGSKSIELTVNGNGDIGPSTAEVVVDGHIGEGEVAIRVPIDWETISADATELSAFTKVRREKIPT